MHRIMFVEDIPSCLILGTESKPGQVLWAVWVQLCSHVELLELHGHKLAFLQWIVFLL